MLPDKDGPSVPEYFLAITTQTLDFLGDLSTSVPGPVGGVIAAVRRLINVVQVRPSPPIQLEPGLTFSLPSDRNGEH